MEENAVIVTDPDDEENSKKFEVDSCHWSCDGMTVNEYGQAVPDNEESRYASQVH
jgi:hypothetical protein